MNLMIGYAGLLSIVQGAFYGTGAYCCAICMVKMNLSFSLSLLAAALFNILLSLPLIWFSIRLRNLFFSLATLSMQIIIFSILYNWTSFTNGPYGIAGIPRPTLFGHRFTSLPEIFILSSIISLLVLLFYFIFHFTPLIRLIKACRDDQLALMTFGKSLIKIKALAIFIAGATSAIAGCLFAVYVSFIDPNSFSLNESILIISIVLIGGLGTVIGSVAGALFYVLLPEALRFIAIPESAAANVRLMIYALILLFMVMFRPRGLLGNYNFEN
jgi:branched-chain amino acid transport system permease protein